MASTKQLRLISLRNIQKVRHDRKFPEPKLNEEENIKRFEIAYHPFDLHFRGRIHKWLVSLSKNKRFKLTLIEDKLARRLVRLYFYPQKKVWFTQEELVSKVIKVKRRQIRRILVNTLLLIWSRYKN